MQRQARTICAALLAGLQLAGVTEARHETETWANAVDGTLEVARSELLWINPEVQTATAGETTPLLIPVTIEGVQDILLLHPSDVRTPDFQLWIQREDGSFLVTPGGPNTTYRGEVLGRPGSAVAASVLEEGIVARIRMADGDEFWLEPLVGKVAGATLGEHALYRTEDVRAEGMVCATEDPDEPHFSKTSFQQGPSGGSTQNSSAPAVAELACDADYEYYLRYGSASGVSNRIQSIVNANNLQWGSEVGVNHQITTIVVRTSSSQPYVGTTAVSLLVDFENEWNASKSGIQRDVAQLYTGKSLIGANAISYNGAICTGGAYGVVQSDYSGNYACVTNLTSHELGHSWGAAHCSCSGYTMYSNSSCSNRFSSTSIFFITLARDTLLANTNCLNGGGGNPPNNSPPAPPRNLTGQAGNGYVSLDWANNTEGDLAGYAVHRGTKSGGPYTRLTPSLVTSSAYTDWNVTNGKTYYYVVTAIDTEGAESGFSNQVAETPGGQTATMHVASVSASSSNAAKGRKRGKGEVVVVDDSGLPVAGATVVGTFSWSSGTHTVAALTDSTGTAVLLTSGSSKSRISFTFCVDSVSHSSTSYNPAANVETCASY